MELQDVKVGQRVRIIDTTGNVCLNNDSSFDKCNLCNVATVIGVEDVTYSGTLSVQINLPDKQGEGDWGNHLDLELVEDVSDECA